MKNKTVVVLGSSRSFGNTRQVIDAFGSIEKDIDIIDLNNYDIGYFDYEFKNANDDFFPLMEKVLAYDNIVFATPIYWYTMSAQLKTFFDRISDLLKGENKPVGRKLRGKAMAVISCGSDDTIFDGFITPFKESADYLGMHYKGHTHTWVAENSVIPKEVKDRLQSLANTI